MRAPPPARWPSRPRLFRVRRRGAGAPRPAVTSAARDAPPSRDKCGGAGRRSASARSAGLWASGSAFGRSAGRRERASVSSRLVSSRCAMADEGKSYNGQCGRRGRAWRVAGWVGGAGLGREGLGLVGGRAGERPNAGFGDVDGAPGWPSRRLSGPRAPRDRRRTRLWGRSRGLLWGAPLLSHPFGEEPPTSGHTHPAWELPLFFNLIFLPGFSFLLSFLGSQSPPICGGKWGVACGGAVTP